jgi:acyl-ACP thioesterase
MDERGRLRLDAVARYLQDVATDDVEETGWGAPEHLWVIRHVRVDAIAPFLEDREVELVTWCSGVASLAAGRRWSLAGDRGGTIEVDSVWVHLGADARPARIDGFGVYAEATGGRRVSTRLWLPDPPAGSKRMSWPLRTTDLDLLGHVNNAAYWEAVEDCLRGAGLDLRRPYRALLDYRHPLDLGDEVELVEFGDGVRVSVAFVTGDRVNAVARLDALTK